MNDMTVVLPAHKEDPRLVTKLWAELKMLGCQVIVVDDGDTMLLPEEVDTIHYKPHVGYGYALKRGIQSCETTIVCTADSDGQHTVSDIQTLYKVYKMREDIKMVVGQRWLNNEKPHRWFGRKVLNFIGSLVSGHYLSDMNSGLRIIDAQLAKGYCPILCDTFSFTTSLSISMVADKHKIVYYPIDVQPRAFGKSHVRLVKDGLITLFYIFYCGIGCRTRGIRAWLNGR